MKPVHFLSTLFTLALLSTAAFAAEEPSTATGRGPGNGEGGYPAGGGSCSYIYSIQKIGQTYAHENDTLRYHIFVRNLGNCRLRHIDISDVLPRGVELVEAKPAPSHSHNRRLEWEHINLAPGNYEHIELKVKVEDDRHWNSFLTNTACAYTPWIGTRICDSVTTTLYRHHDGDHGGDHDDGREEDTRNPSVSSGSSIR